MGNDLLLVHTKTLKRSWFFPLSITYITRSPNQEKDVELRKFHIKSESQIGERQGQLQRACKVSSEDWWQWSQMSSRMNRFCLYGIGFLQARHNKLFTLLWTVKPYIFFHSTLLDEDFFWSRSMNSSTKIL